MAEKQSLWNPAILRQSALDSFRKLDPRLMVKNPVMLVVEIGSVLTTALLIQGVLTHQGSFAFNLQITLWLWFTVLFANFAEAMAEGRGKAQADTLRKAKGETVAIRLKGESKEAEREQVSSSALRAGDVIWVEAGLYIPGDGEVIDGVASVDESAITGESAPVIREAGGDRSAVTGGTKVLSDWIMVRITSNPGETFLDRMIALVEGAQRQKTPNEIALSILLSGLTIIFRSGGGYAATDCCVFASTADHLCSGVSPGLSHTNDDRRAALRDRDSGDGPPGAVQRTGHVRPRGRSGGRRRYSLAG